jgi:hypothetical protein
MPVQTLGEAWKLGWRVRCLLTADNPHSRNKRISIECNTSAELDMKSLALPDKVPTAFKRSEILAADRDECDEREH